MLEINQVHMGNCLDLMPLIPDASVDMILCDLPYQITACEWDKLVPFEPLWEQYKRIVKPNAAIVLTGSQPFTSKLVMSNLSWFKYEWIWDKKRGTNFFNTATRPMNSHENILIFGAMPTTYNLAGKNMKYNSQKSAGAIYTRSDKSENRPQFCRSGMKRQKKETTYSGKFPETIIRFFNDTCNAGSKGHPTQKPVKLFEYLIRTYTDEGDLVLDNCIGSGTTAVAALNTGRNFIGIELSGEYCEIARQRIERETRQERLKL